MDAGEIVVIISKPGSGNSTLLRVIAGLAEPDDGEETDGVDAAEVDVVLGSDQLSLEAAKRIAAAATSMKPVQLTTSVWERTLGLKTEVTIVRCSAQDAKFGHVHGIDELHPLLPEAEVLLLSSPLTAEMEKLVGAPELALLVNVARGKVVDTDTLVAEASTGHLSASDNDILASTKKGGGTLRGVLRASRGKEQAAPCERCKTKRARILFEKCFAVDGFEWAGRACCSFDSMMGGGDHV